MDNSFDQVIYLTRKRWGISGNHEEKIITTKRYENSNDSDRIIFQGDESLIYKTELDKLIIYLKTNRFKLRTLEIK